MRIFVFDTNVLISAILTPQSTAAEALRRVATSPELFGLAMSQATYLELMEVIDRPKFNRYLSPEKRLAYIQKVKSLALWPKSAETVSECRDPNDDKFLELAFDSRAEIIITGDKDLLVLHPWRTISIISPVQFLQQHFS